MDVTRGAVYEIDLASRKGTGHVVIISSDAHNAAPYANRVLALPIVGKPGPAFSVQLREVDPVTGWVHAGDPVPVRVNQLLKQVGMLVGATFAEIIEMVRDFLGLP